MRLSQHAGAPVGRRDPIAPRRMDSPPRIQQRALFQDLDPQCPPTRLSALPAVSAPPAASGSQPQHSEKFREEHGSNPFQKRNREARAGCTRGTTAASRNTATRPPGVPGGCTAPRRRLRPGGSVPASCSALFQRSGKVELPTSVTTRPPGRKKKDENFLDFIQNLGHGATAIRQTGVAAVNYLRRLAPPVVAAGGRCC